MTGSGNGEPLPFELTETDRQNLAQGDAQFKPLAWDDLKEIIGTLYEKCVAAASHQLTF